MKVAVPVAHKLPVSLAEKEPLGDAEGEEKELEEASSVLVSQLVELPLNVEETVAHALGEEDTEADPHALLTPLADEKLLCVAEGVEVKDCDPEEVTETLGEALETGSAEEVPQLEGVYDTVVVAHKLPDPLAEKEGLGESDGEAEELRDGAAVLVPHSDELPLNEGAAVAHAVGDGDTEADPHALLKPLAEASVL